MYVEGLIGPNTINTMPLATMDAYRDHGDPHETISRDVDQAQAYLDSLEQIGVDLEEVAFQLEAEGVRAFAESAEALLLAIGQKCV
jgi:transaldolase